MTVETYGPADLYVVAFPSEHVPDQIREAVLQTLSSGVIKLLDLVLVRRGRTAAPRSSRSRTWATSSI